jgi:hypothetical protein
MTETNTLAYFSGDKVKKFCGFGSKWVILLINGQERTVMVND